VLHPTDRRLRFLLPGFVLAVSTALLLTGCGMFPARTPAPTPADFEGIVANFARRGITVDNVVSGDAGCADRTLARTAISFRASGADQTTPVTIHLYAFANQAAFDRLRESVDVCAHGYVTDPSTFESVDAAPFVLAGQGPWAPDFESRLRGALTEAADQGG
jgi:hypothetical protein